MEWFIWFDDRIIEYERGGSGTTPARLAFNNWKPRKRS